MTYNPIYWGAYAFFSPALTIQELTELEILMQWLEAAKAENELANAVLQEYARRLANLQGKSLPINISITSKTYSGFVIKHE